MKKRISIQNSLYLRMSLTFLVLLAVIGFAYVIITVYYSRIYFQHVNQRLNHGVAANIASNYPLVRERKVDRPALDQIFKHAMSINPNLEVYLLDSSGNILSYSQGDKKVILKKVNLKMVRDFLVKDESKYIPGDDPRNPEEQKVFSAAAIVDDGSISGYLYVVLNSADYDATSKSLLDNFFLELALGTMIWTLIVAFLIGLLLFRILTRNFRKVIEVTQKFKAGDLTARVNVRSTGEVKMLADFFNEMADILTGNIEKVKSVEILRRELIANISHDLRTPLSIIHGYVETLQMKAKAITPEEQEHYLAIIMETTIGLKKMVHELFELSKLEARQVQPTKEPFGISELLNDIGQKHRLLAEQKSIRIITELSDALPPVFADISLIERVIQNLIENAIKFTPSGGQIQLATYQLGDRLQIRISDTGRGISGPQKEKIMAHPGTVDASSGLRAGNGLGLVIVRKILELHDSTLELEQNDPRGSTFSFLLSIHKA